MTLALRISASYLTSHHPPLRPVLIFPCPFRTILRCTRRRGTRCTAADAEQASGHCGARNTDVGSHSPSWLHSEPVKDPYAGWAPLDSGYDADKFTGLLQISAGIALAIAFSLVTYFVFSRKGTKHAPVYSVTSQVQKELPSRSSPDGSVDGHKPVTSDISNTPSSNDSKQEVNGENPQPDVFSASDVHQKKTAQAAQVTPGSIVVPATIDHEQEQALAALQALKVIEPGVEAGGLCTRREYARWLTAITGTLARSPAHKIVPAMYIDSVSELAFNDVVPEDPDFPYIQGLAEAGLISSNLSRHDEDDNGRATDGSIFLPDSPLSRQDLVCWKVSLEGHDLPTVDKQKWRAQTGFIDVDRINEDALPFLAKDLAAGERSIVSTAFGYTRRFQPGKPVTRGQAAIALVTGEAADIVAEELTRLEAEDIAEAAVVAELALEARAQKQVDEDFNTELKLEKDSRVSVEKQLEGVKEELERVMKEREQEKLSLDCIQAAVQAEKNLLLILRQNAEEQLQTLTEKRVEMGIEKNKLETFLKKTEEGGQALADLRAEVDVEKKALILARLWAEDEAKKAHAHAKMLEEVRKRWEGQGIQVRVGKELDDDNIPALGWHYSGPKTELNKFLQRAPVQDVLAKAGNLKSKVVVRFVQLMETAGRAFCTAWQKAADSLQVAGERTVDSVRAVGGKAQAFQQETCAVASKKAQEVLDSTLSTLTGLSSTVTDSTRKVADGFRGEAQKLVGRFKS